MFGRRKIYTDEAVITAANVVEVLNKAMSIHAKNQAEIDYLYKYYKGRQPILDKKKEVRPEINERILVNRAYEIVNFFHGYIFGDEIQYTRRGEDETLTQDIDDLNGYMSLAHKPYADSRLGHWMMVAGVGVRMILPTGDNEAPVAVYTLDPRNAFVVYFNGLGESPKMGVKFVIQDDGATVFSVYTVDRYFEIKDGAVIRDEPHALNAIPIIEYATAARLGAFEPVLSLLDAISAVESNRLDDMTAYVNSFLALLGGTIDEETAAKLEQYKMLCLPEGVDAKYLSVAMQQSDTQVLADNLYEYVLTITGMPNRNGGLSTSDTGAATFYRDGHAAAEMRAASVEREYDMSEMDFLRIALRILRDTVGTKLMPKDITIKFSRKNYENIQSKAQVLTTLLASEKIHPRLAFVYCGMFVDPESAYLESKEWWEELERKRETEMQMQAQTEAQSQRNTA